jgi:uncharacterized protein (DUF1501 family)
VRVAFADIGGWDHHVKVGNTEGQFANILREFSQSLAAFWIDLGDIAEDTSLSRCRNLAARPAKTEIAAPIMVMRT